MLRSQGIPARMAIGFKGGEWNPLGMYYQVQQLHAHAWVEVYLNSEDIPPRDGRFEDDVDAAGRLAGARPDRGHDRSRRRQSAHSACWPGCANRWITRRCCGPTTSWA